MKKMFGVIIVLLALYIALQVIYSFSVGRQLSSYVINVNGTDYDVNETYTSRYKTPNRSSYDKNNYYYEISSNGHLLFSFKIMGGYTGIKNFLSNLMIYKNNDLVCAYPIFKDKVDDMDVICNKADKLYLYAAIKGQDAGLDAFVTSVKQVGYKHPSWDPTNVETRKCGPFEVYPKNVATNQMYTIWTYKGFYRMTSRGENYYPLSTSDTYDPTLTTMVNQYYVVPDYADSHKFTRVFLTNLISGAMETFNLGVTIPYDAFIQGVADNKIYLIDRSNKIQYAINIYDKTTTISGDLNNSTKYYNNGKWEEKPIYEVLDNNLLFSNTTNVPDSLKAYNPIAINDVGGDTDGYYYLYIQEGGNVAVYRADKQNTAILTLLFRVPSVNSIKYSSHDLYFISGDTLYTYRDTLGLRPLAKYSEFVFNKGNLYNAYVNE